MVQVTPLRRTYSFTKYYISIQLHHDNAGVINCCMHLICMNVVLVAIIKVMWAVTLWLLQVALYNGHKMVVVLSSFLFITMGCTMYWQLVFGNCGVLQGISQGKGFVNMSTVDVETSTDVCEVNSSCSYSWCKVFGTSVYTCFPHYLCNSYSDNGLQLLGGSYFWLQQQKYVQI